MKKFLLIALALMLVLGLCACGGNDAEDTTTTTTTTTTTAATTTTTNGFTAEDDGVYNDATLNWG